MRLLPLPEMSFKSYACDEYGPIVVRLEVLDGGDPNLSWLSMREEGLVPLKDKECDALEAALKASAIQ